MKSRYPWIVVLYAPGGCTGLVQPCNVGIQRPLKHAMQQTAHEHIVRKTREKLEAGADAATITLEKRIGVLCD